MPTLQDILNAADLADDFELDFGAKGKVKVSDLRGYRKGVDNEIKVAEMKRREAESLATEAATLLAGLTEAQKKQTTAAPTRAAADGSYDWKTDPLYAPVVAELQSVLAAANAAKEMAEAQKKSLEQVSSVYAYERMRTEYDRAKDSLGDARFEDLAQEAINGKHYDRFGLPTLSPIIDRRTEPSRIKAAQTQAVADARREWDAAQAAAATKSGTTGASRFNTREGADKAVAPPNKRIEDITSEMVASDPDVQAAMRGETVQ